VEIRASWGEYVVITPLFADLPDAPQAMLWCSCAVAADRFAGATETDEPIVQIELAKLRQFVEDLRTLERDRRGEATLTSVLLTLTVRVYDRAGHVSVAADLSDYRCRVSIGFGLDPTMLPTLVNDFEELLAFPQTNSETLSES
jgi:hypothetical protein